MIFAWNIETLVGDEMRSFAKSGDEKTDYEALPQSKTQNDLERSVSVSGLWKLLTALQKMTTALSQVLLLLAAAALVFHVVANISDPGHGLRGSGDRQLQNATNQSATGNRPHLVIGAVSNMTNAQKNAPLSVKPGVLQRLLKEKQKLDQEKIGLAKDIELLMKADANIDDKIAKLSNAAAAKASVPQEQVTNVGISRYKHDYFCTVKRSRQEGESGLVVDFIEVGGRSLDDVQGPMSSTLFWEGGSMHPTKHTYEVDDEVHEFIEGSLSFEGVPKGVSLDFEYGSGGYSKVRLPIVLK